MPFAFDKLNWLAIVVAALATFFLGALWYMPLFGKTWVRLQGWSETQVKEIQARTPPALFFGSMILCYLLVALALGLLITNLVPESDAVGGALVGFVLWLGVAAAIGWTGHISSGKDHGIFLIDTSYQLVYLVMIGAIVGVWR